MIVGKHETPTKAAVFLDDFFKKQNKEKVLSSHNFNRKRDETLFKNANKMRVVLVDELDALITKNQSLLYNLFDWPQHNNSNLLIVSIANTMNLPETKLQGKIKSRVGQRRIVYEPYNVN